MSKISMEIIKNHNVIQKCSISTTISLQPKFLHNIRSCINFRLYEDLLFKYDKQLQGIVLSFKPDSIKILESIAQIDPSNSLINVPIALDLFVLKTAQNFPLKGTVEICSPNLVSVEILNTFKAQITSRNLEKKNFLWNSVSSSWDSEEDGSISPGAFLIFNSSEAGMTQDKETTRPFLNGNFDNFCQVIPAQRTCFKCKTPCVDPSARFCGTCGSSIQHSINL